MNTGLTVGVIIVAAGRGSRLGGDLPKQYARLGDRAVLARTIGCFLRHPFVKAIKVVIHPDDRSHYEEAISQVEPGAIKLSFCHGGTTRQDSVRKGLESLAQDGADMDSLLLIHDAARPFISETMITRAIAAGVAYGAAIPVLPVVDSLVSVSEGGAVEGNPDRENLRSVQTPQAFHFGAIRKVHTEAHNQQRSDFTDDASLIRWAGGTVATFQGEQNAFKLTTLADLQRARRLLSPALTDIRTATGYDVHVFGPGNHIMLGGVRIPHDQGVVGHSDADVLLHALTDALLGCIGDGDIGVHFPPSDPQWKGAESHIFLSEAVRRVVARGGEIRHLDGTVVCEAPKIGPFREMIRRTIASIAGIDVSRVSLKATTSEKVGFTGRREGLAALATATIALPSEE